MQNSHCTAERQLFPRRQTIASRIRRAVDRAFAHFQPQSRETGGRGIESLESRTMLSVTTDASGWTVIKPEAGDRVIYVSSSSGKDTNSGLSASAPVKTLTVGESLIRNNTGDQLLLKAGDTWYESFGIWTAGGKSANEPVVIGSYGAGARPLINTGALGGLQTGRARVQETDHVAIMGLHFYSDGRDPTSPTYVGTHNATGINWLTGTDGLLIENTQVEGYTVNINVQGYYGPIKNVSIRRCVIDNSYSNSSHSQGLYATGVSNLLIEGNRFDHNGYNANVPGAVPTWYNHNIYLASDTSGVIVQDNVIARAASYGLQARSGGIIRNNLFIDDPMGMSFGLVNGAMGVAGGVTGSITGNVFLGGGSLGDVPGVGLEVGNTKAGAGVLVANNIFAHGPFNSRGAINVDCGVGQTNQKDTVGINDLTIQNNIVYDYRGGFGIDSSLKPGVKGPNGMNHLVMTGNQFTNITSSVLSQNSAINPTQEIWSKNFYSKWAILTVNFKHMVSPPLAAPPAYIDPTRTVGGYNVLQHGVNSADAFLAVELGQTPPNWNVAYDAQAIIKYISDGFH